jgi:anti-sigma-K factor RskA
VDHESVRELTAAFALDALDTNEEREFEDHLAHCEQCREEVAVFQEVAALLAYDVETPTPPPTLRERMLEQARSERPNVVPLRRRWAVPAAATLAAVAACAAIGLGIWAASLSSRLDRERTASAQQAKVIPISGAEGSLLVLPSGQATLVVSMLGRAPDGKTYEAWVIEGGKPKPAGTFPGGEGPVAVALTRPVAAGAVVAVTLEPGPMAQPTGKPLFSATV